MKIVDQTPFYNEKGELSFIDRLKATMEFGPGWFKEIEAQKSVISVMKKSLDKNFTLLCNIIPPGLDARIPLILVGPTGLYVMIVTSKTGMFRAKGDQWGVVTGSSVKAENPNLLTRTERMARAIQIYLQKQGYVDLFNVEAILLCSDPATNVDTMRPIIRVIMRDMLERFVATIPQARIVLSPESAFDIVNRLLNPPPPPPSKPAEAAQAAPSEVEAVPAGQPAGPFVTAFSRTGTAPFLAVPKESVPPFPGSFQESSPALVDDSVPLFPDSLKENFPVSDAESVPSVPVPFAEPSASPAPTPRPRLALTRNQTLLLVGMGVLWVLILAGFGFLIAITMNPPLILLK